MEHIGKIISRTTHQDLQRANTSTSSNTEPGDDNAVKCPRCLGTGFVHPKFGDGSVDYASAIACSCCDPEETTQTHVLLLNNSNLGPLSRLTFETLVPEGRSGYRANQELFSAAFQAARQFAQSPAGWMVLIGPSGSGKTHLAAAVAIEQVNRNRPVFYITLPDLLEHLRASYNPSSEILHDDLFDRVRNMPMLVLEDVGIHSSGAWAREKLDQLLSYRFNRELPTLITAMTLDGLDERVQTRLGDRAVCKTFHLEMDKSEGPGYTWAPGLELQKQMKFEAFDWKRVNLPADQRENLEKAYRLAMDYARSPDGWLVWQGVTGSGKTHLASAIVNYLHQSGQQAVFIVVPEFIDHLRSAFSPDSRISYDQLFEKVKTAPFLVLDDFGEQTATPWAQEKLYQVINYRYNARLATVITTTRCLDELDSRIRSRLLDPKISLLFALSVPDYRSDLSRRPARKQYPRSSNRR